jgi:trk system potassium uptake protein TrkA
MRIVILGCGPLVSALLAANEAEGHEVTVISGDSDCLETLADEPRITVLLAVEPLMQDYLQQAGIDNADAFLALTEDDHRNVLLAQIARHIFNVPKVMCRLENLQLQELYSNLGLEVVSPTLELLQDLNQVFR